MVRKIKIIWHWIFLTFLVIIAILLLIIYLEPDIINKFRDKKKEGKNVPSKEEDRGSKSKTPEGKRIPSENNSNRPVNDVNSGTDTEYKNSYNEPRKHENDEDGGSFKETNKTNPNYMNSTTDDEKSERKSKPRTSKIDDVNNKDNFNQPKSEPNQNPKVDVDQSYPKVEENNTQRRASKSEDIKQNADTSKTPIDIPGNQRNSGKFVRFKEGLAENKVQPVDKGDENGNGLEQKKKTSKIESQGSKNYEEPFKILTPSGLLNHDYDENKANTTENFTSAETIHKEPKSGDEDTTASKKEPKEELQDKSSKEPPKRLTPFGWVREEEPEKVSITSIAEDEYTTPTVDDFCY